MEGLVLHSKLQKRYMLSNLKRESVLEVLRAIDEGRIRVPPERASRKYCLVYNDKHYPPKFIISEACRIQYGQELSPYDFSGGDETNSVLRRLDFTVIPCSCGGLGRTLLSILRETKHRSSSDGVAIEGRSYRESDDPSCICSSLFNGFVWRDLEDIDPSELPNTPGVYVIRIKERVGDPIDAYNKFLKVFGEIRWRAFMEYVMNRLERLKRIGECPVIYIGAAPKSLRTRYEDLIGRRHTVMFPILALVLAGWKLEYGYMQVKSKEEAKSLEDRLKREYTRIHGNLPALMER